MINATVDKTYQVADTQFLKIFKMCFKQLPNHSLIEKSMNNMAKGVTLLDHDKHSAIPGDIL